MPRLLITGGSGYLGAHLLRAAPGWETWATYFSSPIDHGSIQTLYLDLGDSAATRRAIHRLRPDAIIHTALSNASPRQVALIPTAAAAIAEAASEANARLVHISTDLIWNGESPPYSDDSPPNPFGSYGTSKAEAERLVAERCPNAIIVRPSLILGLDPPDRQTRWLLDDARAGKRVTLFTDEIRCPVWVEDLCATLLELAGSDFSGRMNLGGPQPLSRWDLGTRVFRGMGMETPPNVVPLTIAESGMVRARDLTMTGERAKGELKTRLRGVDEVLTERKLFD